MKKFVGIMAMAVLLVLPFKVHATTSIDFKCGEQDANGNISCLVTYKTDDIAERLTVTLTEFGGAEINSIANASNSEWTQTSSENNGVWTVNLTSPGVSDEGDLFTFTYHASGSNDCKVEIALGDTKVDIKPSTPTTTPDKPTDNKQTGATLPYFALGAIVLVATGAYLATRNKSKMYRL